MTNAVNLASLAVSGALSADANGNVSIASGNLVIGTAGKGIDFSATSGTGTSELLDDYEEGTWTPTDGSGAGLSFSSVDGIYCKIGRLVIAQASYVYPSTSSGAQARMSGLPFPSTAQGGGFCMYTTASVGFVIRNETNTTNTFFTNVTSPGASVLNSTLSSAGVQVTFIYQTTT
jgi:hypothetical protein